MPSVHSEVEKQQTDGSYSETLGRKSRWLQLMIQMWLFKKVTFELLAEVICFADPKSQNKYYLLVVFLLQNFQMASNFSRTLIGFKSKFWSEKLMALLVTYDFHLYVCEGFTFKFKITHNILFKTIWMRGKCDFKRRLDPLWHFSGSN